MQWLKGTPKCSLSGSCALDEYKNPFCFLSFGFRHILTAEDSVELILNEKFSDAGIQDISTSISIRFKEEYVNDLTERYESDDADADESDKHLEARDRRYSCLMIILKQVC